MIDNLQPQRHVLPKLRDRWVLVHNRAVGDLGRIDSVMEQCFGPKFVHLEDKGACRDSVLTATELRNFLETHPEAAALSGCLPSPKPRIPNVIVFDVCFLEDPLDRLWTAYQRQRRRRADTATPDRLEPASSDARAYFGKLLDTSPEFINDVQVRLLASGGEYARPPSPSDLEAACDVLPRISVLGVGDLFEESAVTGEHFLRPTFPALQFHYAGRGFDPRCRHSRHVNDFRNSVGDAIYLAIKRLNELDQELVAAARREVLRRFALLPNPDGRRASFRERRRVFESLPGAEETAPQPRREAGAGAGAANRPVVLHYHIFKNAGSTIEYVLDRAFGKGLASVHGPDPDSFLDAATIGSYLEAHSELAAVTSHHFLYPKPAIPGVAVFDLCFFRDPLKRLWSMYKYLRRAEPVDDLGRSAKTMDARSFFELLINKHPQVVNSFQVNLLANGGRYTHLLTEVDLKIALGILHQVSILGVVGLFDRSVVAAEYFLQASFPALRFDYVKVNVDPAADASHGPKKDEFRRRVGDEVYLRLKQLNEFDSALVAAAKREVLRRWSQVPDRDARLADFRQRCRELQEMDPGEPVVPLEVDRQDVALVPVAAGSTTGPAAGWGRP